ncbi:HD-GYP domain-containing protein [Cohnella lupini]|uniref:Putative nucleotidyltransferase with HDIG domain n=1 Tax=Cohnella lupini TaxID=1294267 RepID=A0A3D9I8X0_9BACL|nr:HD-GYP domain-containing protein [Cohnella lupini]RED58130.1 putative nucleotidyltransferase with HDIG domain [Cohnella lupini]
MMDKGQHLLLDSFMGKRLNKNIYNKMGTLVVPKARMLTKKDIILMKSQQVILSEEDFEPFSIDRVVDSAIGEVKELFDHARNLDQIPFAVVRDKIVPMIMLISNHPNLNQILNYLEMHDEYVYKHSIGVAVLSKLIGKARGFDENRLLELTTAGFLHDIGKAKLPEAILNKPGKLTAEEYALVKEHTVLGYEILKKSLGIPERYAYVALQHHEREDGSGYPFGSNGGDIDIFSKIVAVADVFHAMVSRRVYKNPVPFYKVLQELSNNAYGALDPAITLSFLKRIMDLLIGNTVILSDGREGKIVLVTEQDPVHPFIEINGCYVDLSKEHDVHMEGILR